MSSRQERAHALGIAAIVLLTVVLFLPNGLRSIPGRDPGVFLYAGQRILDGGLPYRDVWDHKGPVIYYLNAVGLWIGNGSTWGVWVLEILAIGLAAMFSFLLANRVFGLFPAFWGTICWLFSLFGVLHGGNLTEQYALPLQFAALYLFVVSEEEGIYGWRGVGIGVTFALTFFLRQNLIGTWMAMVLFLVGTRFFLGRWKELVTTLASMASGAIAVIGSVLLFFWAHGELETFWDCSFHYNFINVTPTLAARVTAFLEGTRHFAWIPLVVATWLTVLYWTFRDRSTLKPYRNLLMVALIGLPIEFVLTSISGRYVRHYYMAWIPEMSVLFCFFLYGVMSLSRASDGNSIGAITSTRDLRKIFGKVFIVLLVLSVNIEPIALVGGGYFIRVQERVFGLERGPHAPTVAYVKETTEENDYVLMWGAETVVNFLSKRRAPTRYMYQYPLAKYGYQDDKMVREFLDDLQERTPQLVIDTKNRALPPIDVTEGRTFMERMKSRTDKREYIALERLSPVLDFVQENYEFATRIGEWDIYRYSF